MRERERERERECVCVCVCVIKSLNNNQWIGSRDIISSRYGSYSRPDIVETPSYSTTRGKGEVATLWWWVEPLFATLGRDGTGRDATRRDAPYALTSRGSPCRFDVDVIFRGIMVWKIFAFFHTRYANPIYIVFVSYLIRICRYCSIRSILILQ